MAKKATTTETKVTVEEVVAPVEVEGVTPETVEVTEEEINHELGHLLERYTELVTKEGSVENGDIAIIDFEGFKVSIFHRNPFLFKHRPDGLAVSGNNSFFTVFSVRQNSNNRFANII